MPLPLLPGERLVLDPIKVIMIHGGEAMFPSSRINCAALYTIEHNVPVVKVGNVALEDLAKLQGYSSRFLNPDLASTSARLPERSEEDMQNTEN